MLSTLRTHDHANFLSAILNVGLGTFGFDLQRKSDHNFKNIYSTNIIIFEQTPETLYMWERACIFGHMPLSQHTRKCSGSADGA